MRGGEERYWIGAPHSDAIMGLSVRTSGSRRVPWATLVRADIHISYLHAQRANEFASFLIAGMQALPRVMRADLRLVSKNRNARDEMITALAGVANVSYPKAMMYTHTHVITLGSRDDDTFATFPATLRRAVRRPLSAGLVLSTDVLPADLPRLLDLMKSSFTRTGSALQRDLAASDLKFAIADQSHRLLVTLQLPTVTGPERIVAFALGVDNGDHVTYLHGAASREPELGTLPLNYAPMWRLMQWGISRGASWFDLGGITVNADPASPLAGIAEFKRRFGGEDMEVASEVRVEVGTTNARLEKLVSRLISR